MLWHNIYSRLVRLFIWSPKINSLILLRYSLNHEINILPFSWKQFFLLQLINLSQKNDVLTRLNHKVMIILHQCERWNTALQSMLQYVWFVSQVLETGWVDLLAPNLDQIFSMCTSMENWLQTHPKRVLVLHCRVKLHWFPLHTHKHTHTHTHTDVCRNTYCMFLIPWLFSAGR